MEPAADVLKAFGLEDLANRLAHENGFDSPRNLLTLSPALHSDFHHLKVWFEETEVRFS